MKQNDITYQDKLNELRLDISHPNSKGFVFIVVEGDSDIRLFRKLFNLQHCKVEFVPGGKFKLEECVATLSGLYPLIIGIRDADFIHLGDSTYSKTNIFITDLHDMEMTLVAEDQVFSSLIFEYTSIIQEKHLEVRQNILKALKGLSLLKLLNENEQLGYHFEGVGFQDLLLFPDYDLDLHQYFLRVLKKSFDPLVTDYSIVLQKVNVLKASNPDLFQLCNGHDCIKALSEFLREYGHAKSISDEIISSSLRMVFNESHHRKTTLFLNTKSWADSHDCEIY
jgi:hypothetical protein